MKTFIGIIFTIIVVTGAALTILALWDIYPISWTLIFKAVITVAVACATAILLWLIKYFFFKKNILNNNAKNNTAY